MYAVSLCTWGKQSFLCAGDGEETPPQVGADDGDIEMSLWSSLGLFLNRLTHRGDLHANTKPEISDIVYPGSRHAVSIPLIYLILTYLEIITAASTLTAFICYFQMRYSHNGKLGCKNCANSRLTLKAFTSTQIKFSGVKSKPSLESS